jgi:HAD superfamily hydrolase (TIGR01549 family)
MSQSPTNSIGAHRAWLVDLDGTLYHAAPVRLAMAVELIATGGPSIGCIRQFRKEQERMRLEMTDVVDNPFSLQIESTARALGRDENDVRRIVEKWMFRRPGKWIRLMRRRSLLRRIESFRRQGGRTALVSDYPAQAKLTAMRIAHLFDHVVANGEVGQPMRLKPWPDGFLLAAERLGVAPTECLVLGDRLDADGESARRAGMAFERIG